MDDATKAAVMAAYEDAAKGAAGMALSLAQASEECHIKCADISDESCICGQVARRFLDAIRDRGAEVTGLAPSLAQLSRLV